MARTPHPRCTKSKRCSCSDSCSSKSCNCPTTPPSPPPSMPRACCANRNSPDSPTHCCAAGCANARRVCASLDADAVTRTAHPAGCSMRFAPTTPIVRMTSPLPTTSKRRCGFAPMHGARTRDALLQRLRDAGVACETSDVLADAIVLQRKPRCNPTARLRRRTCFPCRTAPRNSPPTLTDPQNGERMLDACAAPGGKTAHLLERADARVTALDTDARAAARACAKISTGSAFAPNSSRAMQPAPSQWWDGVAFDRILLDAPCSATGIIRRQPDIKLHRRASDIAALAADANAHPRCAVAFAQTRRTLSLCDMFDPRGRERAADRCIPDPARRCQRAAVAAALAPVRKRNAKPAGGVRHGRILLCNRGKVYLVAFASWRSRRARAGPAALSIASAIGRRQRSDRAARLAARRQPARRARPRHPAGFRVYS